MVTAWKLRPAARLVVPPLHVSVVLSYLQMWAWYPPLASSPPSDTWITECPDTVTSTCHEHRAVQRRAPQPPHSCRQRAHRPPAAAGEDLCAGEEARVPRPARHQHHLPGQCVQLPPRNIAAACLSQGPGVGPAAVLVPPHAQLGQVLHPALLLPPADRPGVPGHLRQCSVLYCTVLYCTVLCCVLWHLGPCPVASSQQHRAALVDGTGVPATCNMQTNTSTVLAAPDLVS